MGGHTEVTSGGESGHTWKAQLNKRSPAEHGLALRGPVNPGPVSRSPGRQSTELTKLDLWGGPRMLSGRLGVHQSSEIIDFLWIT